MARAPGRINLIGEHTDYHGLPVLPMAIDRDIAALSVRHEHGDIFRANTDPAFPGRRCALAKDIPPYPPGDWGNYREAAVQELLDEMRGRGIEAGGLKGFRAVVDGNSPSAAGMSSSCALVALSALMFLAAVRGEYYQGFLGRGEEPSEDILFPCRAVAGARKLPG